jgi:hypothetical protein
MYVCVGMYMYPDRIKAEAEVNTNTATNQVFVIDEIEDIIELTDSNRKNRTSVIRKKI